MIGLRELQTAVRATLLGADDAQAGGLVCGDGMAPAQRLEIYRHHVMTTLADALAVTFPVVRRLVDPRFFAYAADRYVRIHPPVSPCLFEYGETFADFLAVFPSCRGLPWLSDVARLEWAMNVAFNAEDAAPVALETLSGLADERAARLRLRLDPSASFLRSPWAVDGVWLAHQDEEDELPARLDDDTCLEVRRVGDEVRLRRLLPADLVFRRALADGATLGVAAARAAAEDIEFSLAPAIARLLGETLVVGAGIQGAEGGPVPCEPCRNR
jgi:hypothetical protein